MTGRLRKTAEEKENEATEAKAEVSELKKRLEESEVKLICGFTIVRSIFMPAEYLILTSFPFFIFLSFFFILRALLAIIRFYCSSVFAPETCIIS